MQEFSLANPMEAPRLTRITINMGLGEAVTNPKLLDSAVDELGAITGQRPVVTKAKKSIAVFKLRAGQKIGAMVTLRRDQMYEFLDRLVNFALPRVRDFKGVSPKSFDGRGNYTLGVREEIIFPEINFEKLDKPKGMNITFNTTARQRRAGARAAETPRNALQELTMAKTVDMPANKKAPKWRVRHRNRCNSAVARARSCASSTCAASASGCLALRGDIPGVIKSSW